MWKSRLGLSLHQYHTPCYIFRMGLFELTNTELSQSKNVTMAGCVICFGMIHDSTQSTTLHARRGRIRLTPLHRADVRAFFWAYRTEATYLPSRVS